jgi:hypothetical protein
MNAAHELPQKRDIGNFDLGESMQTAHKSPTHLSMEWIARERLDAL